MADLTRDEIRRACELVSGWEWCGPLDEGNALDADGHGRFLPLQPSAWPGDALALLAASGWHVSIEWFPEESLWVVDLYIGSVFIGPELPTAAVRAVLASAGGEP